MVCQRIYKSLRHYVLLRSILFQTIFVPSAQYQLCEWYSAPEALDESCLSSTKHNIVDGTDASLHAESNHSTRQA